MTSVTGGMPRIGRSAFSSLAAKRRSFIELQKEFAKRPTKRLARLIAEELGALDQKELDRRLELALLREATYSAWFDNYSSIVDISAVMDEYVVTTPKVVPQVPV